MVDVIKLSLDDLIDACSHNPSGNRKFIIPAIQRLSVWKSYQKDELIDTMKSGKISVGALQLFRCDKIGHYDTFLLVEGLHRTRTLIEYCQNPFNFTRTKNLIKNIINELNDKFSQTLEDQKLIELGNKWFCLEMLGNYQKFVIDKEFPEKYNILNDLIKTYVENKNAKIEIKEFIKNKTKSLSSDLNISKGVIPIIINSGNIETDLPLLFKRINNNGTPLSATEILATIWYNAPKLQIKNPKIIEHINNHYAKMRKENNNMDIYKNNNNLYSVYEYIIGLKEFLFEKYLNTFFGKIKDKNFISKLLACCFFGDITDASIEKIKDKIKSNELDQFENKLISSIDFVIDSINNIICIKTPRNPVKLLCIDNNLMIGLIALVFRNHKLIFQKKKYYQKLFQIRFINDNLSDIKYNSKSVSNIVTNQTYITPVYKNEFVEKLNRFISEQSDTKFVNDKLIVLTQILLNITKTIKWNDYSENHSETITFEHIINASDLTQYSKDKNIKLQINCLGNYYILDKQESRRKKSETLLSYFKNQGISDDDVNDKYLFMNDLSTLYQVSDELTDKKYIKFIKTRSEYIKNIIVKEYDKYFKSDDELNDDLDEELNDELDKKNKKNKDEDDNDDSNDDSDDEFKSISGSDSDISEENTESEDNSESEEIIINIKPNNSKKILKLN